MQSDIVDIWDTLAKLNIKWQFNLAKAPWWSGQFEKMIGLVKHAFNGIRFERPQVIAPQVPTSWFQRPVLLVYAPH